MIVAAQTAFDVVRLSKHIGAEIRGLDLRDTLDPGTIRAHSIRHGSIIRCCCSAARRWNRRTCCA